MVRVVLSPVPWTAVLATTPLPQPAAVGAVMVVADPPGMVSLTSPATPLTQPPVTS